MTVGMILAKSRILVGTTRTTSLEVELTRSRLAQARILQLKFERSVSSATFQ